MEQDRCVTNTSSEKGGVELYERWGRPPRPAVSVQVSNHRKLLSSKAMVVSVAGKRRDQIPSGMVWRGEREQNRR